MRLLRGLIVLLVLGAAGAGAWVWHWLDQPLPLASGTVELSIEPGTTPREVANAWVNAGVQVPPRLLYEWFRWSGDARRIRAGSYVAGPDVSPRQLLAKMVQGDEAFERVRLLEGWTLKQFRAELARAPHLKAASAAMTDAQLMSAIGADGVAGGGPLTGLGEDAPDARVGVLDVVDRVLLALLPGQVEVEVERGLVAALNQEEPRGVDADVVEEVAEAARTARRRAM